MIFLLRLALLLPWQPSSGIQSVGGLAHFVIVGCVLPKGESIKFFINACCVSMNKTGSNGPIGNTNQAVVLSARCDSGDGQHKQTPLSTNLAWADAWPGFPTGVQ